MKYLKLFENHTGYEAYKSSQDYLTPNVSYCVDRNEVHFEKYVRDYSKEYLTTKALGTGTISFNILYAMGTEYITSISYSTDNGNTWITITNEDNKESNLSIEVNVNDGDIILWKGNANQLGFYSDDDGDYEGSFFSSTCEFDVSGNVMSMLHGDNFIGKTDYMNTNGIFSCLFSDYYSEHTCMVKSSKDLILPATTLTEGCYYCMFSGCTGLTTAPNLPATTLAQNCYNYMFRGCTGLTAAPNLPATTLDQNCYNGMFDGCTGLTAAPELPATTLAEGCYSYMFRGCSRLNYIKAMFTTAPSIRYTQNWVQGVSAIGTFVKNSDATWNVTGPNGIPNGWTVETASA